MTEHVCRCAPAAVAEYYAASARGDVDGLAECFTEMQRCLMSHVMAGTRRGPRVAYYGDERLSVHDRDPGVRRGERRDASWSRSSCILRAISRGRSRPGQPLSNSKTGV